MTRGGYEASAGLAAADAGSLKVGGADGAEHFIAGLEHFEQVCFFSLHKGYGCFAIGQGGAESRGGESLDYRAGAVDVLRWV
jgi:hypothetical protein